MEDVSSMLTDPPQVPPQDNRSYKNLWSRRQSSGWDAVPLCIDREALLQEMTCPTQEKENHPHDTTRIYQNVLV